jgi:hypothetical protein
MLNRIGFLMFLLLILASCHKEKNAAKKINGTWEIITYKRTESNGLSFFATVSGEMTFTEVNRFNSPSLYTSNISYSFDSDNGVYTENGTIETIEKGSYMLVVKVNSSNIPIDTLKYRILTLTNTDLQLEYSDTTSRIHNLIFKKQK